MFRFGSSTDGHHFRLSIFEKKSDSTRDDDMLEAAFPFVKAMANFDSM